MTLCPSGTATADFLGDVCTSNALLRPLIAYLSHPIALNSWFDTVPRRVLWNVDGEGLDLTLRLRGARGVNFHGFEVNSMRVHGALHTPVSLSVVAQPLRTVRLSIDGTAPSGTLILPTHLRYNSLI